MLLRYLIVIKKWLTYVWHFPFSLRFGLCGIMIWKLLQMSYHTNLQINSQHSLNKWFLNLLSLCLPSSKGNLITYDLQNQKWSKPRAATPTPTNQEHRFSPALAAHRRGCRPSWSVTDTSTPLCSSFRSTMRPTRMSLPISLLGPHICKERPPLCRSRALIWCILMMMTCQNRVCFRVGVKEWQDMTSVHDVTLSAWCNKQLTCAA